MRLSPFPQRADYHECEITKKKQRDQGDRKAINFPSPSWKIKQKKTVSYFPEVTCCCIQFRASDAPCGILKNETSRKIWIVFKQNYYYDGMRERGEEEYQITRSFTTAFHRLDTKERARRSAWLRCRNTYPQKIGEKEGFKNWSQKVQPWQELRLQRERTGSQCILMPSLFKKWMSKHWHLFKPQQKLFLKMFTLYTFESNRFQVWTF